MHADLLQSCTREDMYKNIVLHLDESIRPKVLEWPRLPRIRLPLEKLGCLAKYFSCWHTGCIDVHGWRLNPRNEPQTNERKHCTSSKQGRQMKRGLTSLQTLRQTCAICCDKASTAAIKFSCYCRKRQKANGVLQFKVRREVFAACPSPSI